MHFSRILSYHPQIFRFFATSLTLLHKFVLRNCNLYLFQHFFLFFFFLCVEGGNAFSRTLSEKPTSDDQYTAELVACPALFTCPLFSTGCKAGKQQLQDNSSFKKPEKLGFACQAPASALWPS